MIMIMYSRTVEVYDDSEVIFIDEFDHVQVYLQGHNNIDVDVTGKSNYVWWWTIVCFTIYTMFQRGIIFQLVLVSKFKYFLSIILEIITKDNNEGNFTWIS